MKDQEYLDGADGDGLGEDDVITLIDEDGSEHQFEVLDIIEVDGSRYVICAPADDPEDEGAYAFRLQEDEDGAYLTDVEDDDEWEAVARAWEEEDEDLPG